jgi:thioredoxin reductase
MNSVLQPKEDVMARTDVPRIAILGAGPIGLEAALYARSVNLPVTVYERGRIGEYWHRWGHVRLFSPFGMNTTPLGRAAIKSAKPTHEFPSDETCISGREHLAAYLLPLAQCELLKGLIHTETMVLTVGRRGFLKEDAPGDASRGKKPFRLLVRDKNKERIEEADVVLDCTGTYGQHRWLGDGGIPAAGELAAEQHIAYGLEDVLGEKKNHYAGRNVLVIGGGYSAATTVCNLAALARDNLATWVIWLARGGSTQPIKRFAGDPLKERDRLAVRANNLATRSDDNVEFHGQSFIDAVEFHGQDKGFRVTGRSAGAPHTWEVERVIANVGYTPNGDLYRELQIHECYATFGPMKLAVALAEHPNQDCLKQKNFAADALRNPEPNYFVLGGKSYGRNSNFLLRVGFEQVREVFGLILGKAELDLYKKK